MYTQFSPVSKINNYMLAHQFERVAVKFPTFPALISEASTVNYGQLKLAMFAFAQRFKAMGVTNKSIVALSTGDVVTSITVMLATSLLGCRFVIASDILAKQDLVRPTHFFRTPDAKGKTGVEFVTLDTDWFDISNVDLHTEIGNFEADFNADDPWLVLHTSGTTGRPKFIHLSQRMVTERTAAIASDFPTARLTCAMLFDCTSRPFFARAAGALLNACTIVDGFNTSFWKLNGVSTVFCSPLQFQDFANENNFTEKFEKVEVSGARLENRVVHLLNKHFDVIVDVYGASETNKSFSNLIEVDATGTVNRKGLELDSEVQIIDSDGAPCGAGQTGEVRVRNGYMVEGYVNSPEATKKSFRDGWFYPGDIAMWGSQGELNVIGRSDEVISFGGIKIDAQLIDTIIKNSEGVKDAVCFKSPKTDSNELLAFIVFEKDINKALCIANVRENYQKYTGLPCFLGKIHEIEEIPYGDNGRPLRAVYEKMVITNLGAAKESGTK